MKKRFIIDWRIEGYFATEAETAEEAQAAFDKQWGRPSGVDPLRDGTMTSDEPFESRP